MKHIDEYRDGHLGQKLLHNLRERVEGGRSFRFMEVCGTHTVAIFRGGLRTALPPEITLLSGPGCPVCVTAQNDIDKAIELAGMPGVILVTFGDMLKVPGTRSSLQERRARGADVRIVYSPADGISIAQQNPGKKIVFFGVGFETTVPTIALAIREAHRREIDNFFVLSVHKTIPPPLRALLGPAPSDGRDGPEAFASPESKLHERTGIDGFLLPGHVSAIIGARAYSFLAKDYRVPSVISGFEPLDIVQSVTMLVDQIQQGRTDVEIQYRRVVKEEGNTVAQNIVEEVFKPITATWRGIGEIPASGLALRERYAALDAERAFAIDVSYSREPAGCSCGDMLRGLKLPYECKLFARACTPDHPVGPCMVSSEGTCSAYYLYGDWARPELPTVSKQLRKDGDGGAGVA